MSVDRAHVGWVSIACYGEGWQWLEKCSDGPSSTSAEAPPLEKTIEFFPGPLGIGYTGNLVTGLHPSGQGQRRGVRLGWRFLKIDETVVPNDDEVIHMELAKKKERDTKFEVIFLTENDMNRKSAKVDFDNEELKEGDARKPVNVGQQGETYIVVYDGVKVTTSVHIHSSVVTRLKKGGIGVHVVIVHTATTQDAVQL